MADKVQVQHVNIKIFAEGPPIELGGAIPVFQRWIQDSVCEELLIDVADYRHVPAGPGVLLVGHEANYSLDLSFNRLGLLYNRKVRDEGSVQDSLMRSFRAALAARVREVLRQLVRRCQLHVRALERPARAIPRGREGEWPDGA
jgi:hypothetical protein